MLNKILKAVFRNIKYLFEFLSLIKNKKLFPKNDVLLYFGHNLGGGTELYTKNFLKTLKSKEYLIISNFTVFYIDIAYKVTYEEKSFIIFHHKLESYLNKLNINKIYVNSLVSYSRTFDVIDLICNLYKKETIPVTVMFHDYYPICSSYHLFCEHKSCCNYCNKKEIEIWRNNWEKLFDIAVELRVFSGRSEEVLLKYIPDYANKIIVQPHSLEYLKEIKPVDCTPFPLNIGVMGSIMSEIKGKNVLKSLVEEFSIHLFGITDFNHKNLIKHGKYSIENIRNLIIETGVNFIVFTSVWEETFSYVTSEVIALGLPVICFDVGAHAEKIKKYEKGIIVKDINEMKQKLRELQKTGTEIK